MRLEATLKRGGARPIEDAHDCHESGKLCDLDCLCDCYDCEQDRKALAPCDDCKDRGYTLEARKAYACGGRCDAKLVKSIARVELRLARARSRRVAVVLDKHLSLLQSLVTTMPELPDLRPIVAELEGRSAQLLSEAKRGVVHVCSCGREYSLEQWEQLPSPGQQDDGEGGVLDLKNCWCGSTRSMPVKDVRGAA